MLCSEAIAVNRNSTHGRVSIIKCKRWSCEICHPMNRWRVIKAACRGRPTTMLTLTCKPDLFDTPDEAARRMVKGLAVLRKALAREKGLKRIPMIAVFEKHKSGWPHLHILMRTRWIDQKWLSETWERITGAWCVDIRKIDNVGRAASYVAKYVGKELASFAGCKRWWRSHDYEVEKEEEFARVKYGNHTEVMEHISFAELLTQYRRNPMYYIAEEGKGFFEFRSWWVRSDPCVGKEGSPARAL